MMKRILLVEYATSTIEIIKEIFAHPIFNLTIVNEGEAAKQELSEGHFDLLITAAMLPKFHGFNLSQYTALNYPDTHIIIISEIYKGMDYKHQAVTQYKADDFFEKPFDKNKFKERVFQLLEIFEHDLENPRPMTTTHIIPQDTNKIPTLESLESENKQMTSEDLFGDILEAVQEGQSSYEIKLNDDRKPSQHFPNGPFTTQPIPQPPIKTEKPHPTPPPPPPPQKKTPPVDPFTQRLNVEQMQRDVTSHETKPEEIYIPSPEPYKTLQMPMATQVLKQQAPPQSNATQKIDLGLLDLIKQENEERDRARAKQKNKKIEDDISKKFEETLSGLGLSTPTKPSPATPTKPSPAAPTPPISRPRPEDVIKKTELIPDAQTLLTAYDINPTIPNERKNNADEIGGYEILSLIARGGMAEIYKAKKTGVKGFEKMVALKKILSGYGADAKYIEMFVDEAKIAAQLSHPNIVQIYDLGKKDDFYFIAMEYVAGKDLRHILHRLEEANTTMPEELAIYLTIKILEALSYAHTARDGEGRKLEIVHRDVSPPNILVSYSGNVKLTDFGVSKAAIKLHHTVAGALKGKILYMSPEQAQGEVAVDYRSDIFSAGIILFELITGQKLFMGSSEIGILQKVQEGKIVRPRQYKRDINPHLEAIMLKALEKDINQRFQKAADMIKALDAYMLKNYDNSPDISHLAHFVYTLYKEEIIKENIEINLKPLPYAIKRKPRDITPPPHSDTPKIEIQTTTPAPTHSPTHSPTPSPTPVAPIVPPVIPPKPTPPPAPKSIPTAAPTHTPSPPPKPTHAPTPTPTFSPMPTVTLPTTQKLTPKPEFKPVPQFDPESEVLELSLEEQIVEPPPKTISSTPWNTTIPQNKPEEEEEFHPLIEINFDDEVIIPTPTETLPPITSSPTTIPTMHGSPAPHGSLFAHYNAHAHEDTTRKKRNLLIAAIAIIVLLLVVIIYFLVSNSSSTPPQAPTNPSNVVSGLQPTPESGLPTQNPAETTSPEGVVSTEPPLSTTPTPVTVDNSKSDNTVTEPPSQQDPAKTTPLPATAAPAQKTASEIEKAVETSDKKESKENDNGNEASTDKSQPPQAKTAVPDDTPETPETVIAPPVSKPETKSQVESTVVKEGDLIAISEVDTEPIPISNPISISLSIKRLMMSDQRVLVSFLVDHNGKVETVKLIQQSSMKKLNTSLMEMVKTWTFQPATKNNVRVKVWKNKWLVINK